MRVEKERRWIGAKRVVMIAILNDEIVVSGYLNDVCLESEMKYCFGV
jgi:hypothetical protein